MKMNYLFFCICLLLALSSCTKEESPEKLAIPQSIELRENISFCMTTYNIQAFCNEGLPPADHPGTAESYGQQICESIQALDSDYVNLQEVWCSEVADAIETCLTQAGYDGFVYDEDSGLMSISKNVTSTSQAVSFEGPETGADHLKDKGFIHTSFEIMDGCTINIINTHTQADNVWYEDYLDLQYLLNFPVLSIFTRHSVQSESSIRRLQLAQIMDYMMENIPGCEITILGGDFNIKKEDDDGDLTEEFTDLITMIQGQPAHLITSSPTNQGGDILDYFIISNYDQFDEDIQTVTTTVYDCINPQLVTRYNVFETDNFDYPAYGYIVGTFDTYEEARAFRDEIKLDAIESGDYFLTYDIETETTRVCEVDNDSDHNIVETCIENYDCDQDCTT